jgi:hypothetical protein
MGVPSIILQSPRRDPAPYKVPWRATFSDFAAERICEEVAGGRTLERIAIEECWAPSARQIHYWMEEHPDFRAAYQFARHLRAEKLAEDIIDVAYSTLPPDDKRIIIAAHQWLAGKMNPRDWGERKIIDTNVTATINSVTQLDVTHLTLDEIHAAERALGKIVEGVSYSEEEDDGGD